MKTLINAPDEKSFNLPAMFELLGIASSTRDFEDITFSPELVSVNKRDGIRYVFPVSEFRSLLKLPPDARLCSVSSTPFGVTLSLTYT